RARGPPGLLALPARRGPRLARRRDGALESALGLEATGARSPRFARAGPRFARAGPRFARAGPPMSDVRYDELRRGIPDVRRRWRRKVGLQGAAIVVAAGLLALGVSAYAMDHFRYEPWAVTSFRVFAYVALLALAARFLVLPLWGRVSDERVALYLEENEPSLEAAVLSAVEAGEPHAPERPDRSRVLVARLVESAIEKCRTIDYGRPVERQGLRRASALLAAAAALGMAVAILSPAFLRH